MKKFKTNIFFKHLVLIFSIVYLLGSFTNMLFIPHYTPAYAKTSPASVLSFNNRRVNRVNFRSANFLQIIDKSTLENDQFSVLRLFPKSFLIIFIGSGLPGLQLRSTLSPIHIFYNLQRAYLSFCTFRI